MVVVHVTVVVDRACEECGECIVYGRQHCRLVAAKFKFVMPFSCSSFKKMLMDKALLAPAM